MIRVARAARNALAVIGAAVVAVVAVGAGIEFDDQRARARR